MISLFATLFVCLVGFGTGPPKVIGVIPLSQATNVHSLVLDLIQEGSWSSYNQSNPSRLNYVIYPKFKSKVILLEAEFSIDSVVEISNMCDILLLVTNVTPSSTSEDIVDQVIEISRSLYHFIPLN